MTSPPSQIPIHNTSSSSASVTTATSITLLTQQELSGWHGELAASMSQLPLNLVIVRPDSTCAATVVDSVHTQDFRMTDGEREIVYDDDQVEKGRSLKLTAAKRKTEWGPLVTHCYSCYWKCVLFTLKHLHSAIGWKKNLGGASYCSLATKEARPSHLSSSKVDSNFSEINKSSISDVSEAVIPIGDNDMNVVIEACLGSLDVLDSEVPILIQCLSLLLPKVCIC